ncbi:MAG: TIGR04063 family PEP-CTERM/XrtA system glycosyltransferase [Nitrosomonas sp.]|nr:glycosyltransferase, exosortase A system-associated [Nitrosomonas sp.]
MRILHILDHSIPLHSGYTFRTRSILKAQRALGWETFHLTSTKQGLTNSLEEVIDNFHFYRTPVNNRFINTLPIINQIAVMTSLTQRLNEVVDIVKPDILHAHSPVLNAIPALYVGNKKGIPVVYEVRAFWEDAAVDHGTSNAGGLRYRLTHGLETYALKRANAITTICEGLRNDIVERGIEAHKVTTIPNAVDLAQFSMNHSIDQSLKQRLGLQDKRVIGFIGSFYAYEGLEILLRSLPSLLPIYPNLQLLLVGGGPQENFLKQTAQTLGIQDKVIFTGRVPHEQVEKYYDLIEVLVYPRLSMRLTDLVTPLKPLEAMAQGKLFIASDVGGHRELIRDGETGLLFKSGDPDALAKKIIYLLNTPDLWKSLIQAGRAYVENERNWQNSVARYKTVYNQLLVEQGKTVESL